MTTLGIILASTRPNRVGDSVLTWVRQAVPTDTTIDLIDLRELALPAYDGSTSPKKGLPKESHHAQAWGERITNLDALLILTPQYNGSYPGQLKTAIDYLYEEWEKLPTLLVGYGWGEAADVLPLLEKLMRRLKANVVGSIGLGFGPDLEEDGTLHIAEEKTAALRGLVARLLNPTRTERTDT
ncbi:NADPH-dependent FMN reductase [Brachybacterium sp. UMB0905]|uniref:NADPH-dependent FMN reductase n=1 Tax=Brachybacterium sp. UMB0905 TaxID=2069310 RepID=UPI000C80D450|nr:NAD(P)H-dependent oxidoreductase [Brachybacterium sp. UMB0905]PMC75411.1 NADPH-dependent oxidoreductase [Brachybacterium sp. UMB0905]